MKPPPQKSPDFSPASRTIGFSPRPVSNIGSRNAISLRKKSSNPSPSPALRTHHHGVTSPDESPVTSVNANLTPAEVENIIRQKVRVKRSVIKRAFQTFDSRKTLTVTQGEFRRVLEHHCLPLTTEQFQSLVVKTGTNPNGTVSYTKFLEKFLSLSHHFPDFQVHTVPQPRAGIFRRSRPSTAGGESSVASPSTSGTANGGNVLPNTNLHRFTMTKSPRDAVETTTNDEIICKNDAKKTQSTKSNPKKQRSLKKKATQMKQGETNEEKATKMKKKIRIETIEKKLHKKIAGNLKNVMRGFQMFDYNRDGRIQQHELRRVLENYCFRFTDLQYNILWSRYDPNCVGVINYRDFIRDLGENVVAASNRSQAKEDENAPWDARKKRLEREKIVTDMVLAQDRARWKEKSELLKEMPFSQVEKEFRTQMRKNYNNVKRVLMAFDLTRDGFISIANLKSVIRNFVLPVSENIFQQLMHRFAIRATGMVSWEQFLQKFQDPQSAGNGQTLTIGENHKVNPVREAMEVSTIPEIVEALRTHVLKNYETLKEAFLTLDDKHKGVVLRQDLRRVVETFAMKLPEEYMKELFITLDPSHTGFIDYHSFLRLFEPKEKLSAHKWLFSSPKVNQNQLPAVMVWKSIEDIMNDNIAKNWRQFSAEYATLDGEGEGTITRSHLRRLIEKYAMTLSDEHFEKLWSDCDETSNGRIKLAQFLKNLAVEVRPGDRDGTSTRILNESIEAEKGRQYSQAERIAGMEKIGQRHTKLFSAQDVIKILRDRMTQKDTSIRQSFLRCIRSNKKTMSKRDFRSVLEDIGFSMENSQFEELAETLGFNGRSLEYEDFVHNFDSTRSKGLGQMTERGNNHTVNPTNVRYMTALECYDLLLDRMRENFGSVRSAFYKVDDDHDGVLTMAEFRRLLDSFMFIITDKTFHDFLRMLGLTTRSRLSYREFLEKFEIVDKEEGHPWLNSQHKWNDTRTATELVADQVHKYLCLKSEQSCQDMARAFQNYDADGNSIIKKKELRSILFRFNLPLSETEFEKLWSRYDTGGKGFISQLDFWKKMGIIMAPRDDRGISRRIAEQNYKEVLSHHDHQQAKHEELALNQMTFSQKLRAETVEKELKDRFREHYSSFTKAFRQLDKNKDGYITQNDLRRVLLELNYFLDEEQFAALLRRLSLPTTNTRLSYFDFLKAIDDGRASKHGQRENLRKEQLTWDQSLDHISIDKAMEKLREKLTENIGGMKSAFRAFDDRHTGLVNVTNFRQILHAFCFKLNDPQFRAVLANCRITKSTTANPTLMINWIVFLHDFSLVKDAHIQEWVKNIAPAPSPKELSLDDVEESLREVVTARFNVILDHFIDCDYAKMNVVSKDDFRKVLNQHFARLTDEQFDKLWAKQSVNAFTNLEYLEFLKKYTSSDTLPQEVQEQRCQEAQKPPARRPASAFTSVEQPVERSSQLNPTVANRSHSARPVSANGTSSFEEKLKPFVYKHWQEMLRECKKLDPEQTKSIPADEFIAILDRFGLFLSLEEARKLMTRFDQGSKLGLFSYMEFLRHFILTLKARDEGLTKRKKIHSAKLPVDTGVENESFVEAMIGLREKVLQSWKELRRAFRNIDANGEGVVSSLQFRQVLRQFSIDLSEDDFFHLTSFYDHSMRGQIFYNEFIRAFLQ